MVGLLTYSPFVGLPNPDSYRDSGLFKDKKFDIVFEEWSGEIPANLEYTAKQRYAGRGHDKHFSITATGGKA